MSALFFVMAFVNTILDSLKDPLVITAVGGGAQVIPYLTTYGVLPSSVLFLMAYSQAAQRFSRDTLFRIIITVFLAFFALFAFFLYPNHETLHLHGAAAAMTAILPAGMHGLVGMCRNWTFTAFYCMAELWGDVGISLLFWGLANDTTHIGDASLLYPLLGIGANVAQAAAGLTLSRVAASGSGTCFIADIQRLIWVVIGMGVVALILHSHIFASGPAKPRGEARAAAEQAEELLVDDRKAAHAAASTSRSDCVSPTQPPAREGSVPKSTALRVIMESPQIRCLAVMAVAQGIGSNLLEYVWKSYLRLAFPTPQQYSVFMGEVATWTGVLTGVLMFVSPVLFEKMGWLGVAGATPKLLLSMGTVFFAACYVMTAAASIIPPAAAPLVQSCVVMFGALLYITNRSAKFSLFKPAEEMVYIGLDKDARTKGKAAVDVVGAQAGKSFSSVLQQVLLLTMAGSLSRSLPVLAVVFIVCVMGWYKSVEELAVHHDPEQAARSRS